MTKLFLLALIVLSVVSVMAQDSIVLVGKLQITGLPIHDVWGYVDDSTGTEYALLCASTSGLRVIDISDPSNPMQVGSISGGGVESIDVKIWRNYAYVVAESFAVTGKIIDLSDPTNPVQVGTFPAAHNIFISDSGYMYLAAPGLRIYNLKNDPLNPVEVYNDNLCSGHDISIIDNRLYDFSDDCGTRVYDITNPSSPVLLGTITAPSVFHHSGWPSTDGNYLFICDELASPSQNDITVWDISNLSSPFMVDSFADPNAYVHNLYVIDNYAYVSYYRAGFRVFNITDPTQISLVAEYDTDSILSGPGYGGNFGLFVFGSGGNILASDENNGLYIFSFSGQETTNVNQAVIHNNDIKLYPNPTINRATLSFCLDETQFVSGKIYDNLGKVVKTISPKQFLQGSCQLSLDIQDISSGLYIIKLSIGEELINHKLLIIEH